MGLTEHAGLKALDKRISAMMAKKRNVHGSSLGVPIGYKEAETLRSAFRTAVGKCASERTSFRSEKNGNGTFKAWLSGHAFAMVHRDKDVAYVHFSVSSDAMFFITPDSLEKLKAVVAKYGEKCKVLEDTLGIREVMTS